MPHNTNDISITNINMLHIVCHAFAHSVKENLALNWTVVIDVSAFTPNRN